MKYWQKTFICTLILFIITFDIGVLCLANETFRTSLQSEKNISVSEHDIITESLGRDISAILARDNNSESAIKSLLDTYYSHYSGRGVYIELLENGEKLNSSIPFDTNLVKMQDAKTVTVVKNNDGKYVLVGGDLPDLQEYYLICAKDITSVYATQNNMNATLIFVSVIISGALAFLLFILLKKLSEPIYKLSVAAHSISVGNYSKRVEVSGVNEIADLAESFNNMARRIEQQILAMERQNKQKQEFIDNLAHELRTPLTTIYGYAELIQNINLSDEDKYMATDYIMSESDRLKEMADKLLDLAMLREGKIDYIRLNLSEIAKNAIISARTAAEQKNVEISQDLQDVYVMGDKNLLQSLILNLLTNAVKAVNEKEGKVSIKLYENKKLQAVLEVRDNGCGMTEEEKANCLEPFYRVDKARSRANGGNGLGLALCSNIIKTHDAKLEIESEKGKGTLFRVTFGVEYEADKEV